MVAPRGQLIYFDVCATTKPDGHEGEAELANATATHSETIRDVLGEGNYFLARAHVYIIDSIRRVARVSLKGGMGN